MISRINEERKVTVIKLDRSTEYFMRIALRHYVMSRYCEEPIWRLNNRFDQWRWLILMFESRLITLTLSREDLGQWGRVKHPSERLSRWDMKRFTEGSYKFRNTTSWIILNTWFQHSNHDFNLLKLLEVCVESLDRSSLTIWDQWLKTDKSKCLLYEPPDQERWSKHLSLVQRSFINSTQTISSKEELISIWHTEFTQFVTQ